MKPRQALAAACALLAASACGTTDAAEPRDETLTVLAAASLAESFTKLEHLFEQEHPAVDVRLAFDSSATLAHQVVGGAPADVLATADARTMETVTQSGATTGRPRLFATNTMVLVVPQGNPAGIERFADLARDDVDFVACADSAPCGSLAESLLDVNHVEADPVSYEVDVKAVLTKVELDEADAGLVYATDARAAGDAVETVEIPNSSEAVNAYLVAPLRQSEQADLADAWVELVLSAQGRRVLDEAGFGAP